MDDFEYNKCVSSNSETLGEMYYSSLYTVNTALSKAYLFDFIDAEVTNIDEHMSFTVIKNSDDGNYMFIIFYDGFIDSFWYSSGFFNKDDYSIISSGTSYKDVLKIDKSLDFKIKYDFVDSTYHLCKEGYIKIKWNTFAKKPLTVKSVEFFPDNSIRMLSNYLVDRNAVS